MTEGAVADATQHWVVDSDSDDFVDNLRGVNMSLKRLGSPSSTASTTSEASNRIEDLEALTYLPPPPTGHIAGIPAALGLRMAARRQARAQFTHETPCNADQRPTFRLEPCRLDEFFCGSADTDGEDGDGLLSCGPLSLGSAGHHAGKCTPCKFQRSRRGCRMGTECNLCHYPHEELTHSAIRRAMKVSAQAKQEQRLGNVEQQGVEQRQAMPSLWTPQSIPLSSLAAKYM